MRRFAVLSIILGLSLTDHTVLAGEMATTGDQPSYGWAPQSTSRPRVRSQPRRRVQAQTPSRPSQPKPQSQPEKIDQMNGPASFYHEPQKTACRIKDFEPFNPDQMTAAHKTLPCGTKVRVYNPRTKKYVVVLITDRGPYTGGRIIDLSRAAFKALAPIDQGVINTVQLEVLTKEAKLGPVDAVAMGLATGKAPL